jgi:transcriptional regulator with GAF, ATPase, and Fis domain/NAD-dependent dihydropyrimidine dehydrogenase PreA subunit
MQPITTITEKCRKCYSCVRSCPVKAIKVEKDYAEIIFDRCIGCGNCLSNCPQKAKVITEKVAVTEKLLDGSHKMVAVLGCSFPAYFHYLRPEQLVAALKKIGFSEVHEGAAGAEMIGAAYAKAIESSKTPLISSHCPAVVDLIERHYPELLGSLTRVVSPMIAIGRYLKTLHGSDLKVIYISSCVAGKFETQSQEQSSIDLVLTYKELDSIFKNRGVAASSLAGVPFDGLQPHLGRLFPISGGTFKAFSIATDPLDTEIVAAEGEVNVMGIIRDLASGRITPRIADLRFCYDGCIGGPGKNSELTGLYKRNLVISHFKQGAAYNSTAIYQQNTIHPSLERNFCNRFVGLPNPKPENIKNILKLTGKLTRKDELDCRACGYRSCREYAVAVFQGLADLEMCLPHNLRNMEAERGQLMQKYELARRELEIEYGEEFIIGNDRKTLEVIDLIKQVGPTPTTVLIRGESGTGKELTARAIHRYSLRNDKPLVTLNCTTLTDSLMESELFGHRKGAFTGAIADKKGLFEAADGGTIFLDEIGDITPKLQAELLRVLDIGEVRPVGSSTSKKVDIRLIAATNKDLEDGVKEGWFREDLYYRLNVISVTMPPLRSRAASVPLLAHHFLVKARKKLNKNIVAIEDQAIDAMRSYHWPGNIREMQNVIERAAVLASDNVIKLANLPTIFYTTPPVESAAALSGNSFKAAREPQVLKLEKELLERYLSEASGNVSKAAQLANIPRRTFYRLLERNDLKDRHNRP